MNYNRRNFLKTAATGAAVISVSPNLAFSSKKLLGVEVVNPRNRVPVSLIIDDSTTLVNMAHFGIPQFAEEIRTTWRRELYRRFAMFTALKSLTTFAIYLPKRGKVWRHKSGFHQASTPLTHNALFPFWVAPATGLAAGTGLNPAM